MSKIIRVAARPGGMGTADPEAVADPATRDCLRGIIAALGQLGGAAPAATDQGRQDLVLEVLTRRVDQQGRRVKFYARQIRIENGASGVEISASEEYAVAGIEVGADVETSVINNVAVTDLGLTLVYPYLVVQP